MVATGQTAPAFAAEDQNGQTIRLDDFDGQTLVLYFYPADDTPGCTREACSFRDNLQRLAERNVAVVGVSADTVESHAAFADRYDLAFPLLADPEKEIIQAYDVEGRFGNAARVTVVIGEDGVVQQVYRDVDPEQHAEQVLEDL
ncbi:MAG: peroxiredoxin [Candidatus Nanohaloarchaea archaeon]|nr:peroxiredoxin [Candidatus Nanohaloarchaea archaeon]